MKMQTLLPLAASLCVAVLVWLAAGYVVHPHPIGSLTLLAAGWLGYATNGPHRVRNATIGGTLGLLIGAGIHMWQHIAEKRLASVEEFAPHAFADLASAAAIGGISLCIAIILAERIRAAVKHYR